MADEPIDEPNYRFGVNIVDIGDLRVARGQTRRPHSACHHVRLSYDPQERRIWCRDCENDVDPFDAFTVLVKHFDGAYKSLLREQEKLEEAKTFQLRSLAAREIDKVWRRRNVMPACPSCRSGLFPEDFKDGKFPTVGRQFAETRRNKK